jgi:uncharacterized protein
MSGRVVHFEIPFENGDRARDFYRETFGWTLQDIPEMSYTMVNSGPTSDQGVPNEPGFINGGMLKRDQSPTTGTVLVIDVASIDSALKQIERLGGATVVSKEPVGDMGFVAYFKDPEGNVVGLWESAPQQG